MDYVIKEYPQRFFIMIRKLIAARYMVDITLMTAKSSKKSCQKKRFFHVGCYFLSMIIIQSNNLIGLLNESIVTGNVSN